MEQFFNSDQTHTLGAEKHAMEIHKCRVVLKRIMDDIYSQYMIDHIDKWGGFDEKYIPLENGFYKLESKMRNVYSKQDEINERKEYDQVRDRMRKMHKQDYNYLCKLLAKYIHTWSD